MRSLERPGYHEGVNLVVQSSSGSDAFQEWIRTNAAAARKALANPDIRATVQALLGGRNPEADRQRRLTQIEQDLAGMELRWIRKEAGP